MRQHIAKAILLLSGSRPVPPELAPRVAVTNFLVLLALSLTVVISVIQAVGGYYLVVATNQISTVVYLAVFALNRASKYVAARILMLLYVQASLLVYSYVFGADIGLKTLFYPLMVVPFVLFLPREKRVILPLCTTTMISSIFVDAYGAQLMPGAVHLSASTKGMMQVIYAAFVPVALLVPSWILFSRMKRYEDDLATEQAMVIQTGKLRALGQMAGGLAHEINNPVAIISGFVRIIQDKHVARVPGLAADLVPIDTAAKRIAKVIAQFRTFARDPGKREHQLVDLQALVAETLDFCVEQCRERRIVLHLRNREQIWVLGDRLQLSEVLLSLLSNALDALAEAKERWIRIEVDASDECATIAFTDSGAGIPVAIRGRIMEPFFTTKAIGKGVGLGLSMAFGGVAQHGGRLYLDQASTDTRFVVELPVAKQALRAS